MSDVTQLLDAAAAGDRKAAADLLPLVYDELRKLAAARMAAESPDHTLQPTALVHEAYLRLVGPADASRWDGRGHFFAAAAEAMRRILVDAARRRKANKPRRRPQPRRSGCRPPRRPDPRHDLVALDAALTGWRPPTPRRRDWSNSATSPACPSRRRRKPSGCRRVRRTACGRSHGPGCTGNSRTQWLTRNREESWRDSRLASH